MLTDFKVYAADLPDFKTVDGLLAMGPYKAAWFRDADGNIIELSEVAEPG